MDRTDKLLGTLVAILALSMLLSGGLAVYLTLAQGGGETVPGAERIAPTVPTVVTLEPRIAFVSDQDGQAGIYVMEADGSDRRRMSGEDQGFCLFPSWSPDGKRVAFLELGETSQAGVWVADLDGSAPLSVGHPISDAPSWRIATVAPVWSIHGRQVAFASVRDSADAALQFARADGSGIDHTIPLTDCVVADLRAVTASEYLLLTGLPQGGASNVYTLSAQSEAPTLVMTGTMAADWSPDGERIAVAQEASRSILVLDSGEELRAIAQFSRTPIDVRWSPDGERMAVVTAGSARQGYGDGLYVVDVASGGISPVFDGDAWVLWPEWSPDGKRLIFTRGPLIRRSGLPYGDLWVYDVESGSMDQLTAEPGFEGLGTWSP